MAKFINKQTGAILEPQNLFVLEQMEKSDLYEKVVEKKTTSKKDKED